MPRRVSPAQFNRMVRQAEAKQRKAVRDYNAAANKYNRDLKRAVNEHNSNVRKAKRDVDAYNRKVRAHNRRLEQEIARLDRQASSTRYVASQDSSRALHTAFRRVESEAEHTEWGAQGEALVEMAQGETANSVGATNALLGEQPELEIEGTALTNELQEIDEDLDKRWKGALFSINPQNPDAARHFCTSSREIIARVIDHKAPDDLVLAANPDCELTEAGAPIRREKIRYLLSRSGVNHESLGDFIDDDVDDVLGLFRVFNDGTHGSAGVLDLSALRALKARVEGAIRFLSAVVRAA